MSYDKQDKGVGCLGVMAALLVVPLLTVGLGVAAVANAAAITSADVAVKKAYVAFDNKWMAEYAKDDNANPDEVLKVSLAACVASLNDSNPTGKASKAFKWNDHTTITVTVDGGVGACVGTDDGGTDA